MTDQPCRGAFEAWVSRGGDPDWRSYLQRDASGEYELSVARIAWLGWQGAWLNLASRIVSAAVLHNGIIHSMPRPNRHHNIVHAMNGDREANGLLLIAHGEQGFLDAGGNFLSRPDAALRAKQCGQLTKALIAPPNLYSEDLW